MWCNVMYWQSMWCDEVQCNSMHKMFPKNVAQQFNWMYYQLLYFYSFDALGAGNQWRIFGVFTLVQKIESRKYPQYIESKRKQKIASGRAFCTQNSTAQRQQLKWLFSKPQRNKNTNNFLRNSQLEKPATISVWVYSYQGRNAKGNFIHSP